MSDDKAGRNKVFVALNSQQPKGVGAKSVQSSVQPIKTTGSSQVPPPKPPKP
ncbi:hypothetical protein [Paenirhodobacter enshiensis]|uniref:hypothetical protein n=1 Tax=Paenirhodobacter enshiensis TaxID=1105367 RepID=UPI003FA22549